MITRSNNSGLFFLDELFIFSYIFRLWKQVLAELCIAML